MRDTYDLHNAKDLDAGDPLGPFLNEPCGDVTNRLVGRASPTCRASPDHVDVAVLPLDNVRGRVAEPAEDLGHCLESRLDLVPCGGTRKAGFVITTNVAKPWSSSLKTAWPAAQTQGAPAARPHHAVESLV